MIAITILITLISIIVVLVTSSSSQECPGPVSFNSSSFTIRGPCPNDTVLVAVGSTIQYRCDYIDRTAIFDIPYWYIPELSDIPFLNGEGSAYGITIDSIISVEGHTTLSIPVKEQYLNNTLSIQCGLCSLPDVCYLSGNRLSENITSTAVPMIIHGPPRHLSTSVSNSIVMFQWSRPLASDDNVVFIYTVQLVTNTSSVSILSFNTTNTNITLSRSNIIGNDRCMEYTSWSVSVENSYTMINGTNGGNISVIFQEEPSFSSNITTKILSCSSTNRLELSFTVSSLQPLHTLDYDVWLNDTINISYHSKHNTSITFLQHQLVIIEIPLVSIPHDEDQLYITVAISNECGEDTVEDLPVNGNNVSYCTTSTLLSHVISSTVQTAHVTLMFENLSVIPTTLPTNKSTDTSSPSTVGVIIGCSFAGAFTFIIFSSVIVFIILYTKYSLLCGIDNINSPTNISPSTTMNQVYGITTNNNPLSSTEQTQEEPEQKINMCYNFVKKPQRHDNHDGGGVGLGAGDLTSHNMIIYILYSLMCEVLQDLVIHYLVH